MAYRKRTQYRRRRQYRGRKRARYGGRKWFKRKMRPTRTISRQFMPDRHFTKLRYTQLINAADSFRGDGYYNFLDFRGNSLFDPDASLGGGQPLAFDQLAAIYNKYKVYASKITLKVQSLNNTGTVPYYLAVYPYSVSPPSGTDWIGRVVEQPYCRFLTRNQYDHSPYLKSVMSTAKIWGLPKTAVKSDASYASDVTTNPLRQWNWRIAFGNMNDAATSATNYVVQVTVTYYCEFYMRRILQPS